MKTTNLLPLLSGCLFLSARCLGALPNPDPDNGGITLPAGFRALIYTDKLLAAKTVGKGDENLRGLAVAPNGDVYAKGKNGLIWAMRDTDGDGRADLIKEFGPGDGGTHILFHEGYLYHSSRTTVYRYKYLPDELVPSSPVEIVVRELPAERAHDQKSFAFDESGHLLVEVGSPYNVYSKPDRQLGAKGFSPEEVAKFQETYGGFWRFDASKLNQTPVDGTRFSTGHRHSLSLVWNPTSKNFFMAMMGRDNLNIVDPEHYDALDNAERVAEEFHLLGEGVNLGWPFSYWDPIKNERMLAPEYGGDNHRRANNPEFDKPLLAFPAHWAPLQMCLYEGTQFPATYRGGMFLAFHGSWNRGPRPQAGHKVVFIPFDAQGMPTGQWEDFAEGFAGAQFAATGRFSHVQYRPCGVAAAPDGSLYIGDTDKGRIWRVIYTGEPATTKAEPPPWPPAPPSEGTATAKIPGNDVFTQVCAACHMADGRGVPSMHPPLVGSPVVGGDTDRLINVLLRGPAAVLPPERTKYPLVMPPFSYLNDTDLAALVNYLRARFAPSAAKVTPAQIAAQRAKL